MIVNRGFVNKTDEEIRDAIRKRLIETGQREVYINITYMFISLKQILLEALTRQGWKDQVKKKCKGIQSNL